MMNTIVSIFMFFLKFCSLDGYNQSHCHRSISEAVGAYPANHTGRFVIHVKVGIGKITKSCPNVFMYGDGIGKTFVTGSRFGDDLISATTFANEAYVFIARGITFRNTAGPEKELAPAFRSKGDESALFYQESKQFYGNCRIYGTFDFIFGLGEELIQNSEIIVRDNDSYHETFQVFDYSNRGPGANTEHMTKLFVNFKVLEKIEAANFTGGLFPHGESWLPGTCIPY